MAADRATPAWSVCRSRGLGMVVMRPSGDGELLNLDIGQAQLATLQPFGVTIGSQALLRWGLSDPR